MRGLVRAAVLLGMAAIAAAQQGARAPLRVTNVSPAGTNVPAGRQIVIQFNRPVVPIGRMERTAAEVPVEIDPPLTCQWRWLDTSALACQLGDGDELALATRYTLVLNEGILAEDGATTSGAFRHELTTERPRVGYPSFATWRSPGTPVIRVVFTQAVSESSVRAHLFMSHAGAPRVPVEVEPDTEQRELPRYIRLPGELAFVDFGARQAARVDDRPGIVAGETRGASGSSGRARSCRSTRASSSTSSPGSSPATARSAATKTASPCSSTRIPSSRSWASGAARSTTTRS